MPSLRSYRLPRFEDRLHLGDSGLRVSPFCIGMTTEPATILAAYERGANFFFVSADLHWAAYEASRRGLEELFRRGGGIRDDIVVAVVSYVAQPRLSKSALHDAVQAIKGLERIDVAVLGGAYEYDYQRRSDEYVRHRSERYLGTRAVGASCHTRDLVPEALAQLDLALFRYNAWHTDADTRLLPRVPRPRGSLLYNFKSVAPFTWAARKGDHSGPSATDQYRFVLSHSEIDGVLCSPATAAEVETLATALERGPMDAGEREAVARWAEATRPRKPQSDPAIDPDLLDLLSTASTEG